MVQREFDKHAKTYNVYNQIQRSVAKELIEGIKGEPSKILDLGCGSGLAYEQISWDIEYFCGIDFAASMLSLHPCLSTIELVCADFDNFDWMKLAQEKEVSYIVSASSLQWSRDIIAIFSKLERLKVPYSVALFTGNTFATFHNQLSIESPVYSKEELEALMALYSGNRYYKNYLLEFETKQQLLHFIKASGVSGGLNKVGVSKLRNYLISEYDPALEFEVMYFHSTP